MKQNNNAYRIPSAEPLEAGEIDHLAGALVQLWSMSDADWAAWRAERQREDEAGAAMIRRMAELSFRGFAEYPTDDASAEYASA